MSDVLSKPPAAAKTPTFATFDECRTEANIYYARYKKQCAATEHISSLDYYHNMMCAAPSNYNTDVAKVTHELASCHLKNYGCGYSYHSNGPCADLTNQLNALVFKQDK